MSADSITNPPNAVSDLLTLTVKLTRDTIDVNQCAHGSVNMISLLSYE